MTRKPIPVGILATAAMLLAAGCTEKPPNPVGYYMENDLARESMLVQCREDDSLRYEDECKNARIASQRLLKIADDAKAAGREEASARALKAIGNKRAREREWRELQEREERAAQQQMNDPFQQYDLRRGDSGIDEYGETTQVDDAVQFGAPLQESPLVGSPEQPPVQEPAPVDPVEPQFATPAPDPMSAPDATQRQDALAAQPQNAAPAPVDIGPPPAPAPSDDPLDQQLDAELERLKEGSMETMGPPAELAPQAEQPAPDPVEPVANRSD